MDKSKTYKENVKIEETPKPKAKIESNEKHLVSIAGSSVSVYRTDKEIEKSNGKYIKVIK